MLNRMGPLCGYLLYVIGPALAEWMEGVQPEFFGKREQFTCISGAAGPIHDGSVLVEFCYSPEPLCPAIVRNGNHIWKIARSQASTNG
jgi:hypothetical protein